MAESLDADSRSNGQDVVIPLFHVGLGRRGKGEKHLTIPFRSVASILI
jgi:hypothetical protein